MSYDSTEETLEHIYKVRGFLSQVFDELHERAVRHDRSKLDEPEKSMFDRFTPLLRSSTYGSDEYKRVTAEMGIGLAHHYAHNDHHPEFHEHGIADMDLLQLIEMLADWKAATERHDDGDLGRSIEQNAERFGYAPEFQRMLTLTAQHLGWL